MNDFLQKVVHGGGVVFDLTKWLILALVVGAIVNTFFFSVFVVSGESMDPSFKDGEFIFWQKNVYQSADPKRGDIVVVNYPGDPTKKEYVKRVIGLPGESVKIENGSVYINGKKLNEDYLGLGVETAPDGAWAIPTGQFFVMGDNRPNSNDSRYFGPVERRFIPGKALSVIFPRFRRVQDI